MNEFDRIYRHHKPTGDQAERCQRIRGKAKELAELIREVCPAGRERSLAFTKLEEASFWANAGISRSEEKR